MANAAGLDAETRDRLNKVPTRLRLRPEEVDLAIEAGRQATRASAEFNGFVAAAGEGVEARIEAGIAQGGRRILPSGN
jgi:NTE family protein